MALSIKTAQAAGTRLSGANLTTTPQAWFNAYEAVVLADGGTIVDEAATLAAIEWAHDVGQLGKCRAVSASWGVKLSGTDVVKVYGLGGELFTVVGTGTISHITNAGAGTLPAFKFNSGANHLEATAARNITGSRFGIAFLSKAAAVGAPVGVAQGVRSTSVDVYGTMTSAAATSTFFYAFDTSDMYRGPTYPYDLDWIGSGGYVDGIGNTVTAYGNWNAGQTYSPTDGYEFIDFPSAATSKILLGRRYDASAYKAGSLNSELAEFWLVNDAGPALMAELTARLTALAL